MPEEGFFRAGRTRPSPNVHGPRTRPPPSGGSSRRPRWDIDAGITDRDVAALRWLGQQYAARSDVLRILLGRLSPGSPRVAGQIGGGMAVSHFGWLGSPVQPVSATNLLGALVMLGGVYLATRT